MTSRADEWWERNSTPREKAVARALAGFELTPSERQLVYRERTELEQIVGHYVETNPEIVRVRAALVEAYRRFTDFATPMCVLRRIDPTIRELEAWIEESRAHCAHA